MDKKCIGLIEAIGMASAIEAADAAVKSGNVRLLGIEYSGYDARIVVKVEGNVGAVKAAVESGSAAAGRLGELVATHVIPRPHNDVEKILPSI